MQIVHESLDPRTNCALLFGYGHFAAGIIDWTAEPLREVKIETVAFRGWVPDDSEPLRGTLGLIPGRHGDGRGMAADPRWQTLATALRFAIVACQFTNGDPDNYQGDDRGEVAKAINAAVEHLAKESGHPGAGQGSAGFLGDISRLQRLLPLLQTPSGTRGRFCQFQGDMGTHSRLDVCIPFLEAAVKQRLGLTGAGGDSGSIFKSQLPSVGSSGSGASSSNKLQKINLSAGWLGDPKTGEIAPHATLKGSKSKAMWLPDEATATAWQAYLRG